MCGGAIISQRHILTIASCTDPSYVAFVGALTRNDGMPYTIRATIRHPRYDPRFANNDIAVLATLNLIQFNRFITSITLPGNDIPASNVASTLIGLGDLRVRKFRALIYVSPRNYNAIPYLLLQTPNVNGNAIPNSIKWTNTLTIFRQDCRRLLGRAGMWVHATSLCTAPVPGQGICRGDAEKYAKWLILALAFHLFDLSPHILIILEVYIRVFK